MSKRKIGLVALSLCLVAILAVGGTLAYLTSTDRADNTFSVGSVKIKLNEYQRNDAGTGLEPFENGKVLLPLVGSAQGNKETVGNVTGLPTAKNYVDKIMEIQNVASSNAYVRIYVAIPEALDNVTDAGSNVLHFNWAAESKGEGQWGAEKCKFQSVKLFDDSAITYNVYYRTYNSALASNQKTATPAYIGFYLDSRVDIAADQLIIDENLGMFTPYTIDGQVINYNFDKGVTIPVIAVGVQADGFNSADEAIDTAFGADYNPFLKK